MTNRQCYVFAAILGVATGVGMGAFAPFRLMVFMSIFIGVIGVLVIRSFINFSAPRTAGRKEAVLIVGEFVILAIAWSWMAWCLRVYVL